MLVLPTDLRDPRATDKRLWLPMIKAVLKLCRAWNNFWVDPDYFEYSMDESGVKLYGKPQPFPYHLFALGFRWINGTTIRLNAGDVNFSGDFQVPVTKSGNTNLTYDPYVWVWIRVQRRDIRNTTGVWTVSANKPQSDDTYFKLPVYKFEKIGLDSYSLVEDEDEPPVRHLGDFHFGNPLATNPVS
jgi:hypothetical protein